MISIKRHKNTISTQLVDINKKIKWLKIIGHAPIELSSSLFYFLADEKENELNFFRTGKKTREIEDCRKKSGESFERRTAKKRDKFQILELSIKNNQEIRLFSVSI